MQIVSKKQAIESIQKSISEAPADGNLWESNFEYWNTWARNLRVRIEGIFGAGSPQAEEIHPIIKDFLSVNTKDGRIKFRTHLVSLLRSFLAEVNELWSDVEPLSQKNVQIQSPDTKDNGILQSNRIFVVHGHDHGRMQAVARFLEHLGLEPIVLHERASSGDTVIEKLERHSNASYAVILLTPDDVGNVVTERESLHPRARQNVILELGYFLAKLGRNRTAALVVQGVEIPSDYSGIVYISIDKGDEWKLLLARELRSAGFSIDLNKVI